MKREKKSKKYQYVDDGHTIYDMSGLRNVGNGDAKKDSLGMSRKETRAAVRAAFRIYLPMLLIVILCFFGAMWLIRLWLHA